MISVKTPTSFSINHIVRRSFYAIISAEPIKFHQEWRTFFSLSVFSVSRLLPLDLVRRSVKFCVCRWRLIQRTFVFRRRFFFSVPQCFTKLWQFPFLGAAGFLRLSVNSGMYSWAGSSCYVMPRLPCLTSPSHGSHVDANSYCLTIPKMSVILLFLPSSRSTGEAFLPSLGLFSERATSLEMAGCHLLFCFERP